MHNPLQLEMPLEPLPVRRPHALFFGVRPPAPIAQKMLDVGASIDAEPDPPWTCPWPNMHATLMTLSKAHTISPQMIKLAVSAGDTIDGTCFDVVFDRIENLGSAKNRAIVLGCSEGEAEFRALFGEIVRRLFGAPTKRDLKAFRPHITLWRSPIAVREQRLDHPFRWTVDRFWLIHSFVGEGRHEWPGCWKLNN